MGFGPHRRHGCWGAVQLQWGRRAHDRGSLLKPRKQRAKPPQRLPKKREAGGSWSTPGDQRRKGLAVEGRRELGGGVPEGHQEAQLGQVVEGQPLIGAMGVQVGGSVCSGQGRHVFTRRLLQSTQETCRMEGAAVEMGRARAVGPSAEPCGAWKAPRAQGGCCAARAGAPRDAWTARWPPAHQHSRKSTSHSVQTKAERMTLRRGSSSV
jgi:hypothetical protein